jgi:hypothetical protein
MALCTGLKMRAEAESIQAASKAIAEKAKELYGDMSKFDKLVEVLEEAVKTRAVSQEESS